jgi:hypothetical protein
VVKQCPLFPPKADIVGRQLDVRFVPIAGMHCSNFVVIRLVYYQPQRPQHQPPQPPQPEQPLQPHLQARKPHLQP